MAAFNVNGLTVHRLLQLPVEHGRTLKYKPLSDQVLKVLRADLADVVLLIIDEVSMISNITLLFIHLRLTEIFDTSEQEDGWFGRLHLLVFGDLLQLPPVREKPTFEGLTSDEACKIVGSLGSINIWKSMFTYDELLINMRQKDDSSFADILSRVRLGVITKGDQELLSKRLVPLKSETITGRLKEITEYLNSLPDDTVCLLPTKNMCEQFNTAMLRAIDQPEIEIQANDKIDSPRYLNKRATEAVKKYEDDSSMTAGLEHKIVLKLGARIMLRRNIDVSLGLVNGSIGTVQKIIQDIDNRSMVKKIKIKFNHGLEYDLERVTTKFEVLPRAYVHREQFSLCLAYAITIHKSQGLSINNALMDIGSSVFSCGQAYVALSRVKSLSGVHLINFDPCQVKALESAIVEYNRLRTIHRPDLVSLSLSKKRKRKMVDRDWSLNPKILSVQEETSENPKKKRPSRPTARNVKRKKTIKGNTKIKK
ncbi:hypothetical protein WDU94_000591 [Cyamophila willieti]